MSVSGPVRPTAPREANLARAAFAIFVLLSSPFWGVIIDAIIGALIASNPSRIERWALIDRVFRGAAWLLLAAMVLEIVEQLVVRMAFERRLGRRLPQVLDRMLLLGIFGAGVLGALRSTLGLSLSLLAGIVVGTTLPLAFLFRDILQDLVAGIRLSMDRDLRLGMRVETMEGKLGELIDLGVASVRLELEDGSVLSMRNSTLEQEGLIDRSTRDGVKVSASIVLHSTVEVARVRRILEAAAAAAEGVVPEPEPRAFLETVAPDGAHFRVSFVTKGISSVQATRSVVLEKALRALEVAGVPTDASPPRAFDRVRLVHEQPLFRELTVDECAAMASRARMREEPAGTALCSEGESGSSMFLVAEGLLDVHIGDRGRVGFLGAGDCFGEMSLLSGNPRSATVRAHTAVVLLEIDRDAILPLLQARPTVAEGFAKLLAARNKERAAFLASAGAVPREAESLVNELAARFLAYFGR